MVGPAELIGIQPPYTFGGTLFHPVSGLPAWTGPNGEGGFSTPQLYQLSYEMYDGRVAFYWPNEYIDDGNLVTLGLVKELADAQPLNYLYLFAQIAGLGADTLQAQTAIAIITAESSGIWSAHNRNIPVEDSIGLAQINLLAHPQYTGVNLYNIQANLAAMRAVSNNWTDWTPWSTYNDGAYLQYLPSTSGAVGPQGPQAPPPPAGTGLIRSLVDGLINDVFGGFSILGWHPGNDLKSILDPVADTLDNWVNTLYRSVLNVIDWANNQFSAAARYAEGLIQDGIHDAEAFAAFIIGLGEGAWKEAVAVVDAAWRLALAAEHALWSAAVAAIGDAWKAAVDAVDAAWRFSLGVEHALWTGAVAVVDAAWRAGVAAEHALWTAAVDAVDAAWRFSLGVEHALWSAAVDAVDTAWRDGVALVDAAWKAFVSDVFDPLATEFDNLFGTALSAGSIAIGLIIEVADWIAQLAKISYKDAVAWGTGLVDVATAGPGQWIADATAVIESDVLPHVAGFRGA